MSECVIQCEPLIPLLNHKSAAHRYIIVGISSKGDHTHYRTLLKASREVPGEVFVRLDFSIQPLCGG